MPRSKYDYALPPRSKRIKFKVTLPWVSTHSNSTGWINCGDPGDALSLVSQGSLGSQAPGLDFWIGKADTGTDRGIYPSGVCLAAKIKATIIHTDATPNLLSLYFWTESSTHPMTLPANPYLIDNVPGVKKVLMYNTGTSTHKMHHHRAFVNNLEFFQFTNGDDMFDETSAPFSAGSRPSLYAKYRFALADETAGSWISAATNCLVQFTVTHYCVLRLADYSAGGLLDTANV